MPARHQTPLFLPLAGILLATFVLASAINQVLDAWLAPSLPASEPLKIENEDPDLARLRAEHLGRLFGINPTGNPRPPPGPPPDTRLDLRLWGTLVASGSGPSLAAVEDLQTHHFRTAQVGDLVAKAEIVAIQRDHLVLRRDGRLERLDMGGGQARRSGPPVRSAHSAGPPRAPLLLPGLRQEGDQSWSVPRSELEAALPNVMTLAKDARILPAFDKPGGGFRFIRVRPGSLYTRLGIQSGDVVRRINGHTLDDPERLLGLLQQLRTASRIDVELERDGQRLRHAYRVEGP